MRKSLLRHAEIKAKVEPETETGSAAVLSQNAPVLEPGPALLAAAAAIFDDCRAPLATWFAVHARILPWRAPLNQPVTPFPAEGAVRSPYGVWVSEIMLQQTVVAAVIPHYDRWMEEFPDVGALAAADPARVLRAWAGLGYYARARNLHKGAQAVVERGGWPATAEEWRAIPGVGDYTAGAIASLAFDQPAAILDGNIVRVFSRLLGLGFLPGANAAAKTFYWDLARLWINGMEGVVGRDGAKVSKGVKGTKAPKVTKGDRGLVEVSGAAGRLGRLNEALMELGALVCAPAVPRCGDCPLRGACTAHRRAWTSRLPPPKPRAAVRAVPAAAVVVVGRKGVLLEQRAAGAFLAGHELFPLFIDRDAKVWREGFVARFAGAALHNATRTATRTATVRHTIMSARYEVDVWTVEVPSSPSSSGRWVPRDEMDAVLTNALARKIWGAFLKAETQGRGLLQQRKPMTAFE